jgi:hypothetical protein
MTDSKYTMKTIGVLTAISHLASSLTLFYSLQEDSTFSFSRLSGFAMMLCIGIGLLSLIAWSQSGSSIIKKLDHRNTDKSRVSNHVGFHILPTAFKPSEPAHIEASDGDRINLLVSQIQEKGFGGRFNPRIYQQLGITIDERKWIKRISEYVRQGYLAETYELMCPNCHEIIDVYSKYKDIPLDQPISCVHCAHDFEVSEERLVLMYSFIGDMELKEPLSLSAENPISQADK